MLIVARRRGQRIRIGNDVEIVVTDLSKGTVKLGIVAPATCPIVRGEVHAAIAEANQSAAGSVLEAKQPAGAAVPAPLVKTMARPSVNGQTPREKER
jgi:carbon storage regulator